MLLRVVVLVAALSFAAPALARAQGSAEILRGRVLGPDQKPIRGASVTVVGLQTKLERTAKTNNDGVYSILFSQPEGQYVVSVKALGFTPVKQRVINEGLGDLLVTDFKLAAASRVTQP